MTTPEVWTESKTPTPRDAAMAHQRRVMAEDARLKAASNELVEAWRSEVVHPTNRTISVDHMRSDLVRAVAAISSGVRPLVRRVRRLSIAYGRVFLGIGWSVRVSLSITKAEEGSALVRLRAFDHNRLLCALLLSVERRRATHTHSQILGILLQSLPNGPNGSTSLFFATGRASFC